MILSTEPDQGLGRRRAGLFAVPTVGVCVRTADLEGDRAIREKTVDFPNAAPFPELTRGARVPSRRVLLDDQWVVTLHVLSRNAQERWPPRVTIQTALAGERRNATVQDLHGL